MAEAKISVRARRIVAAGEALYGSRWQSPLARATNISQALLQKISDGSRLVTNAVEDKVIAALRVEAKRLRGSADTVDEIVAKLMKAREK